MKIKKNGFLVEILLTLYTFFGVILVKSVKLPNPFIFFLFFIILALSILIISEWWDKND